MLTNKQRSSWKSQNFEISLSHCHKLVVSILRASFKKLLTKIITYRYQKHFKQNHFFLDLDSRSLQGDLSRNYDEPYKRLSEIFNNILNHHASLKQKLLRAKRLQKKKKLWQAKNFDVSLKLFLTNNGCISIIS